MNSAQLKRTHKTLSTLASATLADSFTAGRQARQCRTYLAIVSPGKQSQDILIERAEDCERAEARAQEAFSKLHQAAGLVWDAIQTLNRGGAK